MDWDQVLVLGLAIVFMISNCGANGVVGSDLDIVPRRSNTFLYKGQMVSKGRARLQWD